MNLVLIVPAGIVKARPGLVRRVQTVHGPQGSLFQAAYWVDPHKGEAPPPQRKVGTVDNGTPSLFDRMGLEPPAPTPPAPVAPKPAAPEPSPAPEDASGRSRRLDVLEGSLKKKQEAFDARLEQHMDDVRGANGQPLNDKRNGASTVGRWDRQSDALRNLNDGIERTKAAIEKERGKISNVESEDIPDFLRGMVADGELSQWRKHPNFFFVPGVDKGRIVWDGEHKTLRHRYLSDIPKEQYSAFRDAFNKANAALRAYRADDPGPNGGPSEPLKEPSTEPASQPGQTTPSRAVPVPLQALASRLVGASDPQAVAAQYFGFTGPLAAGKVKARLKSDGFNSLDELAATAGAPAAPATPSPEKAEDSAAQFKRGDRFAAGDGKQYEVWSVRYGTMEAHPVVDGKAVVNNTSGVKFAITPERQQSNPEYRTDFAPSTDAPDPNAIENRADTYHYEDRAGERKRVRGKRQDEPEAIPESDDAIDAQLDAEEAANAHKERFAGQSFKVQLSPGDLQKIAALRALGGPVGKDIDRIRHARQNQAAKDYGEWYNGQHGHYPGRSPSFTAVEEGGLSNRELPWHTEGKVAPEGKPEPSAAEPTVNLDTFIHIAADSLAKLRPQDVDRVLESCPDEHRAALAHYITKERPELAGEVKTSYDALQADARAQAAPLEPSAKPAPEVVPSSLKESVERVRNAVLNPSKYEDVGEKIGGARKDKAKPLGPRAKIEMPDDGVPAWRKAFITMQSLRDGRWGIYSTKKKGSFGSAKLMAYETYPTEAEAEAAIPLVAVSQKHRVRKRPDGSYGIYRLIGDRRMAWVKAGFPTEDDAKKYMAQNPGDVIDAKVSAGEEALPRPEKVWRHGPEWRKGDVHAQDFRDTFGFRGVEFGNWNSQSERQDVVNHAYDGLHDLATILDLPPEEMSLDGQLGLAFGARGHGGKGGARAHYETDYGTINLTKMAGAGTLAHEWMHALDHYLARKDGKAARDRVPGPRGDMTFPSRGESKDYMSHGGATKATDLSPSLAGAFEHLIDVMTMTDKTYTLDTDKQGVRVAHLKDDLSQRLARIRQGLATEQTYGSRKAPATPEQLAEFDAVATELLRGEGLKTRIMDNPNARPRGPFSFGGLRTSNESLEKLNEIMKQVRNRQGFNADQTGPLDDLRRGMSNFEMALENHAKAVSGETQQTRVATDFKRQAREADQTRSEDYWSLNLEMAARAFSSYVEDKAKAKGIQSDFLSYGSHPDFKLDLIDGPYIFPRGEERERINAAFDRLFDVIRGNGGLRKAVGQLVAVRGADGSVRVMRMITKAVPDKPYDADNTVYYHGTTATNAKTMLKTQKPDLARFGTGADRNFAAGKTSVVGLGGKPGFYGHGFYVTEHPAGAATYAQLRSKGRVLQVHTHPGAILDPAKVPEHELRAFHKADINSQRQARGREPLAEHQLEDAANLLHEDSGTRTEAINRFAQHHGYHGVRHGEGHEVVITHPDGIKAIREHNS